MYYDIYSSSSIYSAFSDGAGLPPHNTPFPVVLMNEEYCNSVFRTGCPSWRQPHAWDAISNGSYITFWPDLN